MKYDSGTAIFVVICQLIGAVCIGLYFDSFLLGIASLCTFVVMRP